MRKNCLQFRPPPFLKSFLCLSRACLGKMFVFIYKWLKKTSLSDHFDQYELNILPRQARDKHRDSTQTRGAFSCSADERSQPNPSSGVSAPLAAAYARLPDRGQGQEMFWQQLRPRQRRAGKNKRDSFLSKVPIQLTGCQDRLGTNIAKLQQMAWRTDSITEPRTGAKHAFCARHVAVKPIS